MSATTHYTDLWIRKSMTNNVDIPEGRLLASRISDHGAYSPDNEGSGHGYHSSYRVGSPLNTKAAAMVKAGLPWPDRPYKLNETRALVEKQNVKWHQDLEIRDFYSFKKSLGTGGFAKVFAGVQLSSGLEVAIKHIQVLENDDRDVVYKEIKHLSMLKDVKQVVTLFEIYELGNDVYIVMELCKGGELHSSFDTDDVNKRHLTYGDVGRIAVCMLILADAMHQKGLVHCDLKPENFCLLEPLRDGMDIVESMRLIDFGLSQRVRGGQAIAGLAGSIPYMAPEIKLKMYDHKVDVWSIGVIVYTLLVGQLPFDGRSAEEITQAAATKKPDLSALHPAVADLVEWLLTKDPKKRPEAREALKHPWLKTTNKQGSSGKDATLQCVSNEVLQNLSVFAASNKLQRAFMHLAVSFMNKSEMQKMLAMFSALSMDRTKLLSTAEMMQLLTQDKNAEDAARVCRTIELVMGKDGTLSIEDFVVASMNQYRNLSDAVIKTMFQSLDSDKDGWITAQDAFDKLQPSGITISIEELTRLFDKYGAKRRLGDMQKTSGVMTYHEFHELMMPSVSQRYTHELDTIVTAFKEYHSQNHFQKLARRIVANHAPETKEISKIRDAFKMLDVDNGGTLTKAELAKGIRTAGYVVSDQDIDDLFFTIDSDGTGHVNVHEFVAGALDQQMLVGEDMLRWVFEFMDNDNTNTINTKNLEDLLDMMAWSESEKESLIRIACGPDTDVVKCELTFDQFCKLMVCDGAGTKLKESVAHISMQSFSPDSYINEEETEAGHEGPLLLKSTTLGSTLSTTLSVANLTPRANSSPHSNVAKSPSDTPGRRSASKTFSDGASTSGGSQCFSPSGATGAEAWRQKSSNARETKSKRLSAKLKGLFRR